MKSPVASTGTNSSSAATELALARRSIPNIAMNESGVRAPIVIVKVSRVLPNASSDVAMRYGSSEAYCASKSVSGVRPFSTVNVSSIWNAMSWLANVQAIDVSVLMPGSTHTTVATSAIAVAATRRRRVSRSSRAASARGRGTNATTATAAAISAAAVANRPLKYGVDQRGACCATTQTRTNAAPATCTIATATAVAREGTGRQRRSTTTVAAATSSGALQTSR